MRGSESVIKRALCLGGLILLTCCVEQNARVVSNVEANATENNMSEKESLTKISLSGKAHKEGEKLLVEYTVKNNTPVPMYVFDEMITYDDKAQPKIDPKTAYCFWEEPNTLRLVRATLNIPQEKDVYALEIPYAREVKPQDSVQGKIELDLPVKEKSPFYPPPEEENSKKVSFDKIRLLIGWTESREGTEIREAVIGGVKVLRIRGTWVPKLIEETFTLSGEAIAYTTTFDRQMPQSK